jgi:hypothetical protein
MKYAVFYVGTGEPFELAGLTGRPELTMKSTQDSHPSGPRRYWPRNDAAVCHAAGATRPGPPLCGAGRIALRKPCPLYS